MNYYISDMHFFHKNVTMAGSGFDGRPYATLAEMYEDMKGRWNQKIPNSQPIRAFNVGCMLPHMDYEPRTLAEIVKDS